MTRSDQIRLLDMAQAVIDNNPDGEGFGDTVDDLITAAEDGQDLAAMVLEILG